MEKEKKKTGQAAAEINRKRAAERKKLHELRQSGRPPRYVSSTAFAILLAWYVAGCENMTNDKGECMPLTASGAAVALGLCSSEYLDEYARGSFDNINDLYWIEDRPGEWTESIIRADDDIIIHKYLTDKSKHARRARQLFDYLTGGIKFDDDEIPKGTSLLYFSACAKRYLLLLQKQAEERLFIKGRVADIFTMKARYKWQEDTPVITHRVEIATAEEARKALAELDLLDSDSPEA